MNHRILLISAGILLAALLLFSGALHAEASTSVFSIQGSSDFGNYQSIFNSAAYSGVKQSEQIFDMEVFIPPAGCQPNVVRSDLLEEQNVPVFCELTALRINPGVDITNIDRITFSRSKNKSDYISGIGFYPANAAIRSQTSLVSTPMNGVLGYVVVVLKQQPNERLMPNFVTENLSAVLNYGTEYRLGIGKSEFYIPVTNDAEFADSYRSYSFFGGMGYLRVASVSQDSALVQVYSSPEKKVLSQTVGLGKTVDNILLPSMNGGQYMKITLNGITLPQTKAKININGEEYEVYRGEKFYNDKCLLAEITSTGGGTGSVKISCINSGSQTLQKNFNDVRLEVDSNLPRAYKIGEKIKTGNGNNYYALYSGIVNSKSFIIAGKLPVAIINPENAAASLRAGIGRDIDAFVKSANENGITAYAGRTDFKFNGQSYSLMYILENQEPADGIKLSSSLSGDKLITGDKKTYFDRAFEAYEDVVSKFNSQSFLTSSGETSRTYGEQALWDKYYLADALGQNSKKREVLSKLETDYPDSRNSAGKTASEILSNLGSYSSEGSSHYFANEGIQAELVSITEPSKQDASVELTYSNSAGRETRIAGEGEILFDSKVAGNKEVKLVLESFNENSAGIRYYCKAQGDSAVSTGLVTIGSQKTSPIAPCDTTITVSRINMKKAAKITVIPNNRGVSRETNFTFSIGIEKRAFSMNLTPEQANKKIGEINEKIAKFEKLADALNSTITAGKLLCLSTSAYLNLKNLLFSSKGTATARTKAMTESWNKICGKQPDFDKCISSNSAAIETSVEAVRKALELSNTDEKSSQILAKDEDTGDVDYSKSLAISIDSFKKSFAQNFGTLKIYDNNNNEMQISSGAIEGKQITFIVQDMNSSKGHIGQNEFTELRTNLYTLKNLPADSSLNEFRIFTGKSIYNALAKLKNAEDTFGAASDLSSLAGITVNVYGDKSMQTINDYVPTTWSQISSRYTGYEGKVTGGDYVNVYAFGGVSYLAVLSKMQSGVFNVARIYPLTKTDDNKLNVGDEEKGNRDAKNLVMRSVSTSGIKNICQNCNFMHVFETEPYKGKPAMLPFDKENGWYVALENNVPTGGTLPAYQASGTPATYWICNVGPNGLMEGIHQGDDSQYCQSYSTLTGQSVYQILGLSPEQSKALVLKATGSLKSAESQIAAGKNPITINGMTLRVQGIANTNTGSKCTDFMSDSDCKLMFNICDPFICPTSRCDLGGQYPVDNVIQSGVIGSLALCAPNFVGLGGDVYVPICITGLHAGLEGWISILRSYRTCINESVTTGKTVGICDQMQSVFVCDFFWRNIGPYVSILSKNIFSGSIFGNKGVRGGGEYLFANDAWKNAENSWNYFINSYASTSNLNVGFSSLTQIGTEVCKMQMSATYPNKLETALNPESPEQFYSYFEELPFNSAVIPPVSQYNVFYHIYAGNEQGHYYNVYLRSPSQGVTYTLPDTLTIDSGYVPQGQEVSQTVNKVLTSGYKELCVRIDMVDHCGFKSVGTDFGLNYAKDKVVASQAEEANIKSASDCISGSPSIASAAGGALGGNVQQASQAAITPQIYNYGVVRVCSGQNPGASTDPNRWKEVGYCDDKNIKCWIDTQSVKDAITGVGIQNQTLSEINAADINQKISEGYLNSSAADAERKQFVDLRESIAKLSEGAQLNKELSAGVENLDANINALYKKLVYDSDKARLLYDKAQIYDKLARQSLNAPAAGSPAAAGARGEETEGKKIVEEAITKTKNYTINDNTIYQAGTKTNWIIEGSTILYYPQALDRNPIFKISNNKIELLTKNLNVDEIITNEYDRNIIFEDLNGSSIDLTKGTITPVS